MALVKCPDCNREVSTKAPSCPYCGRPGPFHAPDEAGFDDYYVGSAATLAEPTSKSGRNRLAAALLALFLGGIGMHKFYLGQTTQGILYLLFCWTLIPALIGFVEGIVLLSMTDTTFNQKYAAA